MLHSAAEIKKKKKRKRKSRVIKNESIWLEMQGIPYSMQSLVTERYVTLFLLQNRNLKQLRDICGASSHVA